MDKYKHTCPSCGQRIEYTIDYCGRQIACPSCHVAIVFPDAPIPSATQKLRLERDRIPQKKKSWREAALIQALFNFPHWKVVGACFVPFAVVGGLLIGASYMRKAAADQPAPMPQAVAAPVGSDAWKKMTDLGQSEQAVQYRLQLVIAAKQACAQAQLQADTLHHSYHGKTLDGDTYALVTRQMAEADRACSLRQQEYAAAENAFQQTFDLYQKLGGQVDYRAQLPR